MATPHWIGSTNAAWNSTANWSLTQNGVGGAAVPIAGDTVYIDKTTVAEQNLNVNQSIGNVTAINFAGTINSWTLAGTNATTAGVTWNLTSPVTIDVGPNANDYAEFRNNITGGGAITKTGVGAIGTTNITTTTWGTSPINLNQGALFFASVNDKLGTGKITMADSTELANGSSTAYTLNNPIDVRGNVLLNDLTAFSGIARGTMTLKAAVDLDSSTRTLTIGGTGAAASNAVTISGPITGTAGFTKAGAGLLSLTNAAGTNTITGPISVTGAAGFAGALTLGSGTGFLVPTSVIPGSAGVYPSVNVSAASDVLRIYATGTNVTFNNLFSGSGVVNVISNATAPTGPNFAAGTLTGLTGTGGFSGSAGTIGQTSGLVLQPTAGSAPAQNVISSSPDLPVTLGYLTRADLATVTGTFKYTGSLASPQLQKILLACYTGTTNLAASTYSLEANQPNLADAPLDISTGIQRGNDIGGNMVFTLAGTHAGNNTVSGAITSASSGTLGITKAQAGRWVLSGANTYTGTTSISGGTLSAQNATAFGTTGAVTQTGGTIEVTGGTALNKAGGALTLISAAGANALTSLTGSNTIACAGVTLSSTIIVDIASGADLTVNNTAAMSGAFGITKNNSGEFGLGTFANTYTGAVTINTGTLTVGNLQNTSTASSLGTGALTSAIALTGTLKYNGTGHSTNRSITFTGSAPALDASGSGAVTFSAATQAAGARTIGLTGSSTAANTLSAALSDGTGAVGIAKSGAGKWVLSNATVNYTGTTSVSAGTLNLGSINRTLSGTVSVSGGTLENSTNTVSANVTMTGGTITAELTGANTLGVSSGTTARLEPTNSANSFSGATTINAGGALELVTDVDPEAAGAGKVLGTSDVSVSGEIITSANSNQRGQMRYGGNLTFNAGAVLRIGFAA